MLFNSYNYIFAFLPLVLLSFFHAKANLRKWILILASVIFYALFSWIDLTILILSILINFFLAQRLRGNKTATFIGIVFNLVLLFYFKLQLNQSELGDSVFTGVILPLGISFYTFQQIAFQVDCYKGEVKQKNIFDYALFVGFFPQLISGPIVLYRDIIPQFQSSWLGQNKFSNIKEGFFLIAIGLFKKIVLADSFAKIFNELNRVDELGAVYAWALILAYSFQIYFDFSGYTDIAIGSAKSLNIELPVNFNSPYKSRNIQEFWSRWHITLYKFLKNYLYTPLIENTKLPKVLIMACVFILSGLWHGIGLNFLFWSVGHIFLMVVWRLFRFSGIKLPLLISQVLTFFSVSILWQYFANSDIDRVFKIFESLLVFNSSQFQILTQQYEYFLANLGIGFGLNLEALVSFVSQLMVPNFFMPWLLVGFVIVFRFRNSAIIAQSARGKLFMTLVLLTITVFFWELQDTERFIYFEF